jgi:hypothetical protein
MFGLRKKQKNEIDNKAASGGVQARSPSTGNGLVKSL